MFLGYCRRENKSSIIQYSIKIDNIYNKNLKLQKNKLKFIKNTNNSNK